MKLAGQRALAFCEKPQGKSRIALIFGADPGLVSTAADMLATMWAPGIDPFNLIKMSDDDVRRDPQLLADELIARSLLGGDRLVRGRHVVLDPEQLQVRDPEPDVEVAVGQVTLRPPCVRRK